MAHQAHLPLDVRWTFLLIDQFPKSLMQEISHWEVSSSEVMIFNKRLQPEARRRCACDQATLQPAKFHFNWHKVERTFQSPESNHMRHVTRHVFLTAIAASGHVERTQWALVYQARRLVDLVVEAKHRKRWELCG